MAKKTLAELAAEQTAKVLGEAKPNSIETPDGGFVIHEKPEVENLANVAGVDYIEPIPPQAELTFGQKLSAEISDFLAAVEHNMGIKPPCLVVMMQDLGDGNAQMFLETNNFISNAQHDTMMNYLNRAYRARVLREELAQLEAQGL